MFKKALFLSSAILLAACAGNQNKDKLSEIVSPSLQTAAIEAEDNKSFEEAVRYWLSLYRENPDNDDYAIGVARNLRYSGQIKKGLRLLELHIKEKGETASLLTELGKAQIAFGQTRAARKSLLKATKANPKRWDSLSALAITFDQSGEYDEALKCYDKALQLAPYEPEIINNKALSLASNGKIDQAVKLLKTTIANRKSNVQIRQNLALLTAAKGDIETTKKMLLDLPEDMAENNLEIYRNMARKRSK